MMKQIILLTIFAATCIASTAQPNPQFVELENYLKTLGLHVTYGQLNKGEGIEHKVQARFWISHIHPHYILPDNPLAMHQHDSLEAIKNQPQIMALDSIRRTFSELAKSASESYLYEYHRGRKDTIEYSLAFANEENDSSITIKLNNVVGFRYMREVGRFHFHSTEASGNLYGNGVYTHHLMEEHPLGLSWEQLKPFDGDSFLQLIQPILKNALKQRGVTRYSIHWQHDEGYKDDTDRGLQLKTTWFTEPEEENKHTGLTTGAHYVFPKEQEALALDVHHQLDSIAFAYVNAHPEQLYSYRKTDRYYSGNWATMLAGSVHHRTKEKAYELNCFFDEDGFHLVSITTVGELWVPRDWKKLKRWVNGKGMNR